MTDARLPFERLKPLLEKIDPAVLQQVIAPTGGVLTIMFTDIVDSTKVKAELGDPHYFEEILGPHNKVIRDCITRHNGRELKTIGDAFLVVFAVPAHAVACASEIQQRLAGSPIQAGPGVLRIRIGLHTGTPTVYRDSVSQRIDLAGTAVDKAARVQGLARGGQVLISEETRVLAKPKDVQDWGLWELKGLGRHRILEILWPGKTPERPSGRPWLEPVRFLTRFVGRGAELAQVMNSVLNHRLVTLRGMGGIGKTRLADEAATRVSQEFDDGVFFVELAYTRNSEDAVVAELVAKLGVRLAGFPDQVTALLATWQNRRALLVLDNFEAVMSAVAMIGRVVKRCPGLHFLVTSQRPLGIAGEQQIEVVPMPAPAAQPIATADSLAQLDSFKLFRERARLKKVGWELSRVEEPLVVEILELTDGIPLSIELAATRVERGPLSAIRDGLRLNCVEILKRSGPAIEEQRHAGIRACIDWSFNLLSPEDRALFPKLAVFVGGFFAEDAAQVCQEGNASALLDSIWEQSLLAWQESLGKARYRMLPTVQAYAAERLGDRAQEMRTRHAQHFLEVLYRADDQIRGKGQMTGIARISADLENIRAGMETATQAQDHRMVVRYSQAFGTYLDLTARFAESLLHAQEGLFAAQALNDTQLIAGCQNNLGIVYRNLPTGDRAENLQTAIACYEAAVRGYESAKLADKADRMRRVAVALRQGR